MAITIPEEIPESFRAGDTVKWYFSSADFPASDGGTLVFTFIAPEISSNKNYFAGSGTPPVVTGRVVAKQQSTGSATGVKWLITLAAGTSAGQSGAFAPGRWRYITKHILMGVVDTVAEGYIDVLPDLASITAASYDERTIAQLIVDACDRAIANLLIGKPVRSYGIGARNLAYMTPDEIWFARKKYASIVASEKGLKFQSVDVEFA